MRISHKRNTSPTSALPEAESKAAFVKSMFDEISPRYDIINRIMTMRLDVKWRKYAASALGVDPGSMVLDVATGTGDFVRLLRRQGFRCIGIDFSLGMLKAGGIDSVLQGDASRLPFPNDSFDAITCGFALRNFVSLDDVLAEMARILHLGGRIALLEVSRPTTPGISQLHSFYFDTVVPKIGTLLSNSKAYHYLPESTAYLPSESQLREKLINAGFSDIEFRYFLFGTSQVISATLNTGESISK